MAATAARRLRGVALQADPLGVGVQRRKSMASFFAALFGQMQNMEQL